MSRERSAAYPVLDLAAAYRVLRQDLWGLGAVELGRAEMAKRLGYQAAEGGLAARKVGALVQYGILDRRVGRYSLSPLGLRLQALSLGDAEFPSAIRAALEHPTLFKEILRRYQRPGKVPRDLAPELADFGITQRASAQAAEVFRSSALFAGVIDTDGFIQESPEKEVSASVLSQTPGNDRSIEELDEEWDEIPLLLTKKRQGVLRLPRSLEPGDYFALKDAFLAAYKLLPQHLGLQVSSKRRTETKPRSSSSPLHFPHRKNS